MSTDFKQVSKTGGLHLMPTPTDVDAIVDAAFVRRTWTHAITETVTIYEYCRR